jgi:electron transfer flavoprotein alpha subunit
MKNIALFVEFKNDELTGKSLNLLNKIIDLTYDNLTLYTISTCNNYHLPKLTNVNLIVVETVDSVVLATKELISNLTADFTARKIQYAFAYKSILIDSILPQIAIKLSYKINSQVIDFSLSNDLFTFKTSVFNNKAIAHYSSSNEPSCTILNGNFTTAPQNTVVESITVSPTRIKSNSASSYQITQVKSVQNAISLSDATIVVGAGRGLKSAENWNIIEELAETLHAATACSKPVSDLDWRPHHEHVGQTGVKIAPDIYIACGISGAIQHLAGVNSSKTIVVINNDPEAPFFKNADYGIIGDVFDIVPRLTKKLLNR